MPQPKQNKNPLVGEEGERAFFGYELPVFCGLCSKGLTRRFTLRLAA